MHAQALSYAMHNYGKLQTILQISQIVNYAQLCTCIIPPPLDSGWAYAGHPRGRGGGYLPTSNTSLS